ncbi:MAG: hypothetical protein ACRDA5_05410, partial [Clostridium sp.]
MKTTKIQLSTKKYLLLLPIILLSVCIFGLTLLTVGNLNKLKTNSEVQAIKNISFDFADNLSKLNELSKNSESEASTTANLLSEYIFTLLDTKPDAALVNQILNTYKSTSHIHEINIIVNSIITYSSSLDSIGVDIPKVNAEHFITTLKNVEDGLYSEPAREDLITGENTVTHTILKPMYFKKGNTIAQILYTPDNIHKEEVVYDELVKLFSSEKNKNIAFSSIISLEDKNILSSSNSNITNVENYYSPLFDNIGDINKTYTLSKSQLNDMNLKEDINNVEVIALPLSSSDYCALVGVNVTDINASANNSIILQILSAIAILIIVSLFLLKLLNPIIINLINFETTLKAISSGNLDTDINYDTN